MNKVTTTRTKSRAQRSAPILKEESKSNLSAAERVTKSSCSAASPRSIPELYEEKAQNLRAFSFSELRQATNGFNRMLKIGEGGFGSVFKGTIKPADGNGDSPIVVAIKMLNRDGFQVSPRRLILLSTYQSGIRAKKMDKRVNHLEQFVHSMTNDMKQVKEQLAEILQWLTLGTPRQPTETVETSEALAGPQGANGKGPTSWICRAEQFFRFQVTPEADKVGLASFHLEGDAQLWYQLLCQNENEVSWPEFEGGLQPRFGFTQYYDPFGELTKLQQQGSIKDYQSQFEKLLARARNLPQVQQGHKQWVAEVQFLGIVEHPNLVKLIGYCAVDGERGIQRLLVYEFMPNKSLEDHLFNRAFSALSWKTRLQIVLGAAQGLTYLHEELEVQVIYRDFKSSNVLLDEAFNPKLSDFGLAREGPTAGHTHVSTAVVGTYGYAAPDYVQTGHLTTKSDVWSFGVVLYEILTGRRSFERNLPKMEQRLLDWVKQFPADSKKFGMIMDPRLERQYSLNAARKIAKLADQCLLKNAKERPLMSWVVESLKQIIQVSDENPSDKSFECNEDDSVELDEKTNRMGPSESAIRRMAHLAKLNEHVGGVSRRKFMFMQRAKVP
ncbi:unnamed protein product [Camellia sinensis]